MKSCDHILDGDAGRMCNLGLYGGHPKPSNCIDCMRRGQNTPEHAENLKSIMESSHPEGIRRVSGCCDSAENY